MLHNDAAQQRAGEQPASAPNTSQKSPRAQRAAKSKIPTLKPADSRHGDMVATVLRDWSMDTMSPIYIHGSHSPPSLPTTHEPTPHAIRLYDTIPSGMDTGRPTRSSDLSLVRDDNNSPDRRPRLNCSTHNT